MSSRPSARPSQLGTGDAADDLDYFVEMLAGTRDTQQVEQITRTANDAMQQAPAQRKARPGDKPAAAPAPARFINAEHVLEGHKGFVFDIAVHAATSRLFSASADKTIGVWDLATMKLIDTLRGHTNNVYVLAIDEASGRLFSGSWDNTIRVWNLNTLKEMRCLKDHNGYVASLTIDHEGGRLFSGSWDMVAKVWDLRTLKCLDTLSLVHTGVIYDVMVHNDLIFTASQDSTIRTWSNRTYNPKDTCGEVGGGQHTDWVISITAAGDRMFSASRDKTIKVWDLTQKHIKPIHKIEGHEAAVTSLLIKGKFLLSADGKGIIKIHHIDTFDCIDTIPAHKLWIYRIRSVGDHIFTCSRDKTIKVWT